MIFKNKIGGIKHVDNNIIMTSWERSGMGRGWSFYDGGIVARCLFDNVHPNWQLLKCLGDGVLLVYLLKSRVLLYELVVHFLLFFNEMLQDVIKSRSPCARAVWLTFMCTSSSITCSHLYRSVYWMGISAVLLSSITNFLFSLIHRTVRVMVRLMTWIEMAL